MPQIRQPCAGALGGADLRLIAHMNSDDREADFWMRQERMIGGEAMPFSALRRPQLFKELRVRYEARMPFIPIRESQAQHFAACEARPWSVCRGFSIRRFSPSSLPPMHTLPHAH